MLYIDAVLMYFMIPIEHPDTKIIYYSKITQSKVQCLSEPNHSPSPSPQPNRHKR